MKIMKSETTRRVRVEWCKRLIREEKEDDKEKYWKSKYANDDIIFVETMDARGKWWEEGLRKYERKATTRAFLQWSHGTILVPKAYLIVTSYMAILSTYTDVVVACQTKIKF